MQQQDTLYLKLHEIAYTSRSFHATLYGKPVASLQ